MGRTECLISDGVLVNELPTDPIPSQPRSFSYFTMTLIAFISCAASQLYRAQTHTYAYEYSGTSLNMTEVQCPKLWEVEVHKYDFGTFALHSFASSASLYTLQELEWHGVNEVTCLLAVKQ